MLSRYTIALKRLNGQLDQLSEKYKSPKIRFWLDALYCYLVHGASPRDYINFGFYKVKNLERKQFVTMKRTHKIERLFNAREHEHIFNNKQNFNKAFSEFVNRRWIYAPEADETEIINFISQLGKVVVKPTGLSSGKGIYILESKHVKDSKAFCAEVQEKGHLIEEFIIQDPEIAKLNPTTVNTVRVYTLIDKMGKCEIIFAALRVGGANAYVDNFHNGGVGYVIDIDSGVVKQPGVDIVGNHYLYHPSSQILMVGYRIPKWDELKKFVLKAANVYPKSRYIGWDVAITPFGFEMVEGNYMADPGFLQSLDKIGKYKVFKNAL